MVHSIDRSCKFYDDGMAFLAIMCNIFPGIYNAHHAVPSTRGGGTNKNKGDYHCSYQPGGCLFSNEINFINNSALSTKPHIHVNKASAIRSKVICESKIIVSK